VSPAPVHIFESPDAIGRHLADHILDRIATAATKGRRFLLGLPTGRTPQPVYASMAERLVRAPQSLAHVTLVMMDEYVTSTNVGFTYASALAAPVCHAFVVERIVTPFNQALAAGDRLAASAVWFPDPDTPSQYDRRIAEAGGIDFFLTASGASDGHVAFNPPGTDRESLTRIVALSAQTRHDNLQTFPQYGTIAQVPTHGVTVGVATICAAREVVMVAWGEGKRETVRRMREATAYDASWPATLIHECSNAEILVDRDAEGPDA
jgi:glucosamine-6-phosphate deaminase